MIGGAILGACVFAAADVAASYALGRFPESGEARLRVVCAAAAWLAFGLLFSAPLAAVVALVRRRPYAAGACAALAAAPLAFRAGTTLLEGARVFAAFAELGAGVGAASHGVARVVVLLSVLVLFFAIGANASREGSRGVRALRGLLMLACGLYVHATVYSGLYPAFHEVALAVAWCGALEVGAAATRAPRRAALAAVLAAWIGGGGAWLTYADLKTRGVATRALPATGAAIEALGPYAPPPFGAEAAPPAPRVAPWSEDVLASSLAELRKGGLPETPSFLLVTIDALRADRVGVIGGETGLTPRIDALAARGWTFTRAYSPASITFHTVASMMRGLYPDRVAALPHPDAAPRLAERMGALGRRTFASFPRDAVFFQKEIGKDFSRPDLGFAEIDDDNRRDVERVENLLAFLKREPDRPFFAWLHLMGPHAPYAPEGGPRFGTRPADLQRAEIFEADRLFGALLDRLTIEGLDARTVVVVAADHGESFGERGTFFHGLNVYDEEVRVPLIAAVPGATPAVVSSATSLVDLVPTFLHLSGAPPPEDCDGRSLAPLGTGSAQGDDRVATVVHRHPGAGAAWRAAVRPPYKAILNERTGARELFDLEADPAEKNPIEPPRDGAADSVLRALNSPPEPAKDRAAEATRRRIEVGAAAARGDPADPRWDGFLGDPSAVVRVAAIESLAGLPGDLGGDRLRAFAIGPGPASDAERMKALALANRNPRFDELESHDDRVRYAAAYAAAKGRAEPPYDQIRRLVPREKNQNVRFELVAALDRANVAEDDALFEGVARADDYAGARAAIAAAKRRIGAEGLKKPGANLVDATEASTAIVDDATVEITVPAIEPSALARGAPLVWAIFAIPGRDAKEGEFLVRRGDVAWPSRVHVTEGAAAIAFRLTTEPLRLLAIGAKARPAFVCALIVADP